MKGTRIESQKELKTLYPDHYDRVVNWWLRGMTKEEIDALVVKLPPTRRKREEQERRADRKTGRDRHRREVRAARRQRYITRRIERDIPPEVVKEIARRYTADPKRVGIHREIAETLTLKPWLVWKAIARLRKDELRVGEEG